MVPTAISQITEQVVRVGVMIVAPLHDTGRRRFRRDCRRGTAWIRRWCAGLVVMGLYWRKHIRATRSKAQGKVGHGIRARV